MPAKLERLNLRGCSALRKIGGLCGVAKLEQLDIRGCYNIQVEELPQFGSSTRLFNPGDIHDSVQEKMVEKEMADLHEGVLPHRLSLMLQVKSEHLRWVGTYKDGPYAEALSKHEEKQRHHYVEIQSWKEALSRVSGI